MTFDELEGTRVENIHTSWEKIEEEILFCQTNSRNDMKYEYKTTRHNYQISVMKHGCQKKA